MMPYIITAAVLAAVAFIGWLITDLPDIISRAWQEESSPKTKR